MTTNSTASPRQQTFKTTVDMAMDKTTRYFMFFIVPVLVYITLTLYLKEDQPPKNGVPNRSQHNNFAEPIDVHVKYDDMDSDLRGVPADINLEDDVEQKKAGKRVGKFWRGLDKFENREENPEEDVEYSEIDNQEEHSMKDVDKKFDHEDEEWDNALPKKLDEEVQEEEEKGQVEEKEVEEKEGQEEEEKGQEEEKEVEEKTERAERGKDKYRQANSPVNVRMEPNTDWCKKRRSRMLLLVFSPPEHTYERQTIRQTWAKKLPKDFFLIFVMGKSEDNSNHIDEENKKSKDILQGDFKDHKRSETTKFMMILFWFSRLQDVCKVPKLVLKTVDNIYVNSAAFQEWVKEQYPIAKNIYLGRVVRKDQPIRNQADPRYVPRIAFHQYIFPDYLNGPQYLFSSDVIHRMSYVSKLVFPIALEDAYIGLLCDRLGIRPTQDENFHLLMRTANVCVNAKLLFIFCKSPKEMTKLHKDIINSKKSYQCQPPKRDQRRGL